MWIRSRARHPPTYQSFIQAGFVAKRINRLKRASSMPANGHHDESVSCVDLPSEIDVDGEMGVHSMVVTSQSTFQAKASPSYDECVAQLAHAVDEPDETD